MWPFLSYKEVARQISDADVVDDYTLRIKIDVLIREKTKKIEITAEHRLRPHRCGDLREEGHPRGEHRWG